MKRTGLLAGLLLFAIGCGGSQQSAAKPESVSNEGTTVAAPEKATPGAQHVARRRRFEVKHIEVFSHNTTTGFDKTWAELNPESALVEACKDGWEPYAIERTTHALSNLESNVMVQYYLKREMP